MKQEEFISFLSNPQQVAKLEVETLRKLSIDYPYSQIIQLLYAIRLRFSSEHLFNRQLGKTAVLTNDRSVLFELFEDQNKVAAARAAKQQAVLKKQLVAAEEQEHGLADEPIPGSEQEEALVSDQAEERSDEELEDKSETEDQLSPVTAALAELEPEAQEPEAEPKRKGEESEAEPDGSESAKVVLNDRMKAILEKNRRIREEFEQKRKGAEAKEESTPVVEAPVSEPEKEGPRPEELSTNEQVSEQELLDSNEEAVPLESSDPREEPVTHPIPPALEPSAEADPEEKEEVPPAISNATEPTDEEAEVISRIEAIRNRLDKLQRQVAEELEESQSDLIEFDAVHIEKEPDESDQVSSPENDSIDELALKEEGTYPKLGPIVDGPSGEDDLDDQNLDQELLEIEVQAAQMREDEKLLSSDRTDENQAVPSAHEENLAGLEQEQELEELSFSAWLKKLTAQKEEGLTEKQDYPSEAAESNENQAEKSNFKEKVDLMDDFLEKLPEIKKKSQIASSDAPKAVPVESKTENSSLVTETLAKIYIRQKHYKKALQAYEILKLKYPEKSSFFASQISEIKKLINNK